jgi:glycosyltransferase involved in cell wall biosynthesis
MTVHDYHLISPDKDEFLEKIGRKYWKFLFLSQKYSLPKRLLLVLKTYFEDFCAFKKKIDLFIVPSQFVARKLQKWGIDEKKIIVLPHFISNDFLKNILPKSEENYAFYFGRISKEKGVLELMEIFKNIDGIKLYLAGEIEDNTKIISNKNIIYLGKLSKEEVGNYIKSSKFCISFSKLPETFGLIALESIALGKPFIGLDAGAYKEIIDSGKTGFICKDLTEAKEKITKIISDQIIFDEKEIARIAQEKFADVKYYQEFMKITKSLTN